MKQKQLGILILLFTLFSISFQAQARSMIYDILEKGSQWTLNVDGDSGTLELLGGSGVKPPHGGWSMTMTVKWNNIEGTLIAQADADNAEQHVAMSLTKKNGIHVNCEGYIGMETDRFMAGISVYAGSPNSIKGSWYATVIENGKRRTIKPDIMIDKSKIVGIEKRDKREFDVKEIDKKEIEPGKTETTDPGTGNCSISGKVFGSGAGAAGVFSVNLYGPNDFKVFKGKKKFDNAGQYSFPGLPNGKYKLVVDTKADIAVGPHPNFKIVDCVGGAVTGVDFELK
jgi:hypothetical protein